MVNYKCFRCGYETHIKTIFIRHLSRKNDCDPILHDINIEHFKQYILSGNTCDQYLKNHLKSEKSIMIPNDSINIQNDSIMIPNDSKICIYECNFCKKKYSTKSNLTKHKKICKEKKKDDEVKQSMSELVKILNEKDNQINDFKKELEKRDKQIDELIKKAGIVNNNTINIQNNIKLLNYNDTDTSHLTDNDILKCLNHSNFCIPYLIEKIHFNIDKPENHNVYISNLKNNYVMMFDGNKWNLKDRDEQINNLLDDKQGIIEHKLEEWIENGKKYPVAMKKFNRYLEKKENNKVLDTIKNEIKLILYNNRSIVNINNK